MEHRDFGGYATPGRENLLLAKPDLHVRFYTIPDAFSDPNPPHSLLAG